ncbi:MAG: glycosyltransferase family 4 protein [Candidatus Nitrosotenuis sp.]
MPEKKKRIAVVNPVFYLGGSEAVAVWTIEALKHDYDVTFITTEETNWSEINEFFGTNIRETEVRKVTIPTPFIPHLKGFLLKLHLAQRYYKKNKREYDLAIATRGEMDLGERGIQYIHIPLWNESALRELHQITDGLLHRSTLYRKIYKGVCSVLSGFNYENMKKNITLTNSNWTSAKIKEVYGIESKVLYPPVRIVTEKLPWENRENGFICIGSISPDKNLQEIIQIVARIRTIDNSLHLHIIGPIVDRKYSTLIQSLCAKHADWLRWEESITRNQLDYFIGRHKFGLHGKLHEHFGIAVAEMVSGGCICFVPQGGGQIEIVKDERLIFKDADDAVAKILSVLNNTALQRELRLNLSQAKNIFSHERFMENIRNEVMSFFHSNYQIVS